MCKTSNKDVIDYLSQFIGKEIIRTEPTSSGDNSYLTQPIVFVGFTPYQDSMVYTTSENSDYHPDIGYLPFGFIDCNWKEYVPMT